MSSPLRYQPGFPDVGEKPFEDVSYLHARVDGLIEQVALELGLLRSGDGDSVEFRTSLVSTFLRRLHAADDAVAERFGRSPRRVT